MAEYRWNQAEAAAGYDAAAEHVHPYYAELQETLLDLLPIEAADEFLLIDLGGGSGRMVEKFLTRFSRANAIVVDQSEAFLQLAWQRLERFGSRAELRQMRLQEDWLTSLVQKPRAIVSMSAIHHLDPAEKQALYQRCFEALVPDGVLMNGDEVRPEADADYLAECRRWVVHVNRAIDAGLIPPPMQSAFRGWEARNVGQFGTPRTSGDDCHETIATQLGYFAASGFAKFDCPWQKDLWAVLRGIK